MRANWLIPLMAPVALMACSPEPDSQTDHSGILYCIEGNPETFNPQLVTSGTTLDITAQIYDRLIEYLPEQQSFQPALATDWNYHPEALEYRFTIRENVQFHHTDYFSPTRPLTAEDIVFSFERWIDESHPFHSVSGSSYPFLRAAGLPELIREVRLESANEVVIRLNHPDSTFLFALASDFPVILSAEYAEQLLEQGEPQFLDQRPVGTGAYQFRNFRKDVSVRLERHDLYWREPAQTNQLVFRITPSDHKRMLMLLTHDCHISPYPPARDIEWLDQQPQVRLQQAVSPNTAFWAFNTQREPFDDPRVRQALSHAIDRDTIIRSVYQDWAVKAESILPDTSWAHLGSPGAWDYNPEKARELLEQSGYGDGFTMDVWALPVQRAYNPNARMMAERIQSDLAKIGVRVNIVTFEWSTFRRRLAEGRHDSVLIGWSADYADPDNFFRPLLSCAALNSGNNRAMWCDPDFDSILELAYREESMSRRTDYYHQAQLYLSREVPLLPIAHSIRFQASLESVRGLTISPYGGIDLRSVYLATDSPAPDPVATDPLEPEEREQ